VSPSSQTSSWNFIHIEYSKIGIQGTKTLVINDEGKLEFLFTKKSGDFKRKSGEMPAKAVQKLISRILDTGVFTDTSMNLRDKNTKTLRVKLLGANEDPFLADPTEQNAFCQGGCSLPFQKAERLLIQFWKQCKK
jgi:hypothetical protein